MPTQFSRLVLAMVVLAAAARPSAADRPSEASRWSVGTSAWLLANALLDKSPHFYYLEIERRFGKRHTLVIEPTTWRYWAPIGIPFGSSYGDSAHDYPGFVRSVGVGVGWRYTLYRGLNASVRSIHFLQLYDENNRPRKTGYQLFLQARLGWRWPASSPGFWIEPSIGFNWWPIEVGRPESFRDMDERWPSYFLFEPWLNAGWSW